MTAPADARPRRPVAVSPRRWALLVDPVGRPGWRQMAIDQALLDRTDQTGQGALRLYRWDPWCLSFGRHEPALRRYDRAAIARRGLDTVRRPTGGRAVWHARELTYAVAAPIAWFGTLTDTCRAIHERIASALRILGVNATLAAPAPAVGVAAGACFASAAGGELTVNGRKLLGSAQLRQGSAFLQHGSLLLADDQRLVAELTLGQPPAGHEITLSEAVGRPVEFGEVCAVLAARRGDWGGEWFDAPDDLDLDTLGAAFTARFRDPAWTWRR